MAKLIDAATAAEKISEIYKIPIEELVDVFYRIPNVGIGRADEGATMFASDENMLEDRKVFVRNLGWLLSQTRDGVTGCELNDNDTVTIFYRGGGTHSVNVAHDSYGAIIRDVAREFQ